MLAATSGRSSPCSAISPAFTIPAIACAARVSTVRLMRLRPRMSTTEFSIRMSFVPTK
jgi:hypothetical protein